MEYFFVWIFLAALVGMLASDTTLGFWSGFLFSVLLSPVIGFIIYLFYPAKTEVEKRNQILKNQEELLRQQLSQTKSNLSVPDELEKLENLRSKKIVSEEEYNKLREKIIG